MSILFRSNIKHLRCFLLNSVSRAYELIKDSLDERARRLFCASEAMAYGYGGIAAVFRVTGMASSAIGRGKREIKAIEASQDPVPEGRQRRPGGGRKKATEKDPTLLDDLKELVESTTRGDPESPLLWTARSQRNLVDELKKQGHQVSKGIVSRLLKKLGYSLQGNKKRLEGAQHPDRNAQFEHINETIRRQHEANEPAISVDTKKKENVGNYKNGGKELRPKHDPELVEVYDFPKVKEKTDKEKRKADKVKKKSDKEKRKADKVKRPTDTV